MKQSKIIIVLLAMFLASCAENRMYINSNKNIEIENIVSKNTKISKLKINNLDDVKFLENWVADSKPDRVEFWCKKDNHLCQVAKVAMIKHNVTFHENETMEEEIINAELYYNNVTAEDCLSDNFSSGNDFGCVSSSNMVKMLPDRSQIIEPKKLGVYHVE